MCKMCPRNCQADRIEKIGFCKMGMLPTVAKAYLHMWEEPCISGTCGSGTVFFSGCNLTCVFCQNSNISQEGYGKEITTDELSEIYLRLQSRGAHNINLVSPTHYIDCIKESLIKARQHNLNIPVVYNSNGYDSVSSLKTVDGLINVYLPDIKYISSDAALKFSGVGNYFEIATKAVLEMYNQVGEIELDDEGIIKKGLVIRHMILPGMAGESIKILNWIKESLPSKIIVSIMSQYTPYHRSCEYPEINRRIIRREYEKVLNHFYKLDFENGYFQERDSAQEEYIPDFNLEGVEF